MQLNTGDSGEAAPLAAKSSTVVREDGPPIRYTLRDNGDRIPDRHGSAGWGLPLQQEREEGLRA